MSIEASELEIKQENLHARILSRAMVLGYDPTIVKPIFDGVVDWRGYLAGRMKICWILKEPYADKDGNGNPKGGGWMMFKDVADAKTLAQTVNGNKALRNVAYASWGLQVGVKRFAEIPGIMGNPSIANAPQRVCYINTGKMPAATLTPNAQLFRIQQQWRDIVLEQIHLANPDLLIFAGTLQVWAKDFGVDLSRPIESVVFGEGRSKSVADIHLWNRKLILWTNHPSSFVSTANWVDSIWKLRNGGAKGLIYRVCRHSPLGATEREGVG